MAAVAALVRHGDYHQLPDVPSAHQPFGLTDEGRAQARDGALELARVLEQRGWALDPVVDSSQMLRAWQTAQIFCQQLGLSEIVCFDALAERGLGCAANLTVAQIERILREDPRHTDPPPGWKADSHYRLPLQGAESLLDAGGRVAAHLRDRTEPATGTDTVKIFVGHGAAFRHAAHLLGMLDLDRVAALSMHHGRPVFLRLEDDGRWRHAAGEWKQRPVGMEPRD